MKIHSVNPSDGKLIKKFNSSGPRELTNAVQKAKAVFDNIWSKTSIQEREKFFNNLASRIKTQANSILDLILLEAGKPKGVGQFEIDDIVAGIPYYISEMKKLSPSNSFPINMSDYPETVANVPLLPQGVIGVITPWNFPFWTPMTNIVPAILAGNTVVFKPDEHTSLVGLKIKELFDQSGFPEGVINILLGAADVGRALVTANIDKIVITGSVDAGSQIIRQAGIKPVLLELGGNDAAIVCKDANLEMAVGAICWGAFYNAGQACNGIKRVFVHKAIADEFVARAVNYTKQLKRGRDYGPIIDEEARTTIVGRVKDAVKKGSRLLVGGKLAPTGAGFWLDPVLLVYEKDDLSLVRDETFGPIMPIRIVNTDEEAIQLANSTEFGLGANVWTKDFERGNKIAMQLQAKMVCVNEALFGLPGGEFWGGWKNSGLSTTENRLLSFLKRKLVFGYSGSVVRGWWYPPDFQR